MENLNAGGLMETAENLLREELNRRGMTAEILSEKIETQKAEEEITFREAAMPALPRIWAGFLIIAAWFPSMILEFALNPNGEYLILPRIATLAAWVFWLTCVHRFHRILGLLTVDGYAISPDKAVLFHFIPLYNLYWVFKWPLEMERFINNGGRTEMLPGGAIACVIGVFTIFGFFIAPFNLIFILGAGVYLNRVLKREMEFRAGAQAELSVTVGAPHED